MTQEPAPELRIGRITRAHGVRGAVRVELLTDFPDRFAAGRQVQVDGRRLRVKTSREQEGGLLVSFDGVEDRDATESLLGRYCTVPLSEARKLPGDRYYHFQLVGLSVYDQRQARAIGRVAEVLSYAANDVLRVTDGSSEHLIPMLRGIVKTIGLEEGVIKVELPEEAET